MIKRHAFSLTGWVITLIFGYLWHENIELLKNSVKFDREKCNLPLTNYLKSPEIMKPKKVMIAIQFLDICAPKEKVTVDNHCAEKKMIKKSLIRNHFHELDREIENIEINFKFFITDRENRVWQKTGRDRHFRDSRALSYDMAYDPWGNTMPFGLLLSFGITSNLFFEKVFDFEYVFILDDTNWKISEENFKKSLKKLETNDVIKLRTHDIKKSENQYQLGLGYKALNRVAHHAYMQYPEHPLERNYSVMVGFNMMHKTLPADINRFQKFFDEEIENKFLTMTNENYIEPDVNPIEYYYGLSEEDFFDNIGSKKYDIEKSRANKSPVDIGFYMTPENPCNPKRNNSKAEKIMTTFVTQTRMEILQRKLYRLRVTEYNEKYPETPWKNESDNFSINIMGRANKNELFEIPRQLLQDDFTYKDVIVADFIEAHEKIKYDRQETSYVHQAAIEYAFRCFSYEKVKTDFVIILRPGRFVKSYDFNRYLNEIKLDPNVPTILCLEGSVQENIRPNIFDSDLYILPGQFPLDNHYPPHCLGSYLLTNAAVKMIHKNIGKAERNNLRREDIFITGILRILIGLNDIRGVEKTMLQTSPELNPFV